MDELKFLYGINNEFRFSYCGNTYFVKSIDVYENGINLTVIRFVDYEKAADFYEMYVSREESLSEEEIKEALSISPFRGILNLKSVAIHFTSLLFTNIPQENSIKAEVFLKTI